MKTIYKYDESSITHIVAKTVPDDYGLGTNEFAELPTGYTPYQLVDGKLVASTKEASDAIAQQYLQKHDLTPKPSEMQTQMTMLTKLLAQSQVQNVQTQNQVKALQAMVIAQNKQIQALKGKN